MKAITRGSFSPHGSHWATYLQCLAIVVESVKRKVEKPKKKQKQKRGRKRKKMVEDDFDEDEEMEFGTREETMTEEGGEEVVAGLLKHFIKVLSVQT